MSRRKYRISAGQPCQIDLGKRCRNWVTSEVPFWFQQALHCAGEGHYINGGNHQRVVLLPMKPDADGKRIVVLWG